MIEYGKAPIELGLIELDCPEMMFWLYCPITLKGKVEVCIPDNLRCFTPLIAAVLCDIGPESALDNYIYITAKTIHVSPSSPGNRPGWHVDGYGSNGDLNYIWSNKNPTEFAVQEFIDIPDDDEESLWAFEDQVNIPSIQDGVNCHLYKLDESVVHRVGFVQETGVRTFVKISVSQHQFRNEGNSHNHNLGYDWDMISRSQRRNLDAPDTTSHRYGGAV